MASRMLQGDVFERLPTLPAGSIDCAVTSPPYWQLRSYLPKGHPLKRFELGNEPTPRQYVENIVRVFELVKVALANHGTCWINIGDTYATGAGAVGDCPGGGKQGERWKSKGEMTPLNRMPIKGIDSGNLCLIPQRLSIALQDAGWIVRSYIIWHKPAPMPASITGWIWRRHRVKVKAKQLTGTRKVGHTPQHSNNIPLPGSASEWTDCPGCKKCLPNGGLVLRKGSWRPTSSYEPILMLAKTENYYADGEAVKVPSVRPGDVQRIGGAKGASLKPAPDDPNFRNGSHQAGRTVTVGDSANPRDVYQVPLADLTKEELIDLVRSMDDGLMPDCWKISGESLKAAHYAAFPTELVKRCLLAGTSQRGYCRVCGAPWVRVVERQREHGLAADAYGKSNDIEDDQHAYKRIHRRLKAARAAGEAHDNPLGGYKTLGWRQSCSCPAAEPRPGVVLDPFAGSGRTLIAASRLNLDGVGIELNPGYVTMAEKLIQADVVKDAGPLFAEEIVW